MVADGYIGQLNAAEFLVREQADPTPVVVSRLNVVETHLLTVRQCEPDTARVLTGQSDVTDCATLDATEIQFRLVRALHCN
ncbi:MAG: hypothetical protein J07HQW2_03222 [Haloquadratum walsbyi J07HQW2]|uniref:Uncharacterized protein n=1 Tax=Haloquadratum walsbyi J07HQW2 TaxID=1238425 RepID=U1N1K6_9EURY|nr:MAG: hypothetical protein J07HQW2_03222 [Haloquadratum walsbyi J07HQW2]